MGYFEPAKLPPELRPFHINATDPSTGRTNVAEPKELLKNFLIPLRNGLNSSVRKISNPTTGTNPSRNIGYSTSKEYALDETTDKDSNTGFQTSNLRIRITG